MASENDVTTTGTTAPSNPKVTQTIDQLLGGVQDAWKTGPAVFNESLYGGVGGNTNLGWEKAWEAANNPAYSSAVKNGLNYTSGLLQSGGVVGAQGADQQTTRGIASEYERMAQSQRNPGLYESTMLDTATGKYLNGGDPYFESNLARTLDETGAGVNSVISAGGRFGSGAHVGALGKTLGGISDTARSNEYNRSLERQQQALQGIGAEQQQRFGNEAAARGAQSGQIGTAFGMAQQGVNNAMGASAALPSVYQSSLLPSQTVSEIGAAQDANVQAQLLGRNDLFRRQNDSQSDLLAKLSSILGVNAGAAGTTTTETSPGTPWWQSGISLLGQFV